MIEPKREYRIYGFSKHCIEDDYICSIFAQDIKEAYMVANDIRVSWFIENYDDLEDVPDLGVELDKRNIDPDDYDRVFVLMAELAPQYTNMEIEESSNI